jgi:transposase
MAAPRKYPDDLRERATRLAVEARRDPASSVGAIRRIADQIGVHPEALRTWVKQAETGDGARPGATSPSEAARIAELEREVRELRRANQILKSAASFFAAELDRPSR